MPNDQKMQWKIDTTIEPNGRGEQATYEEARSRMDRMVSDKNIQAKIRRRPDGSFDVMVGTPLKNRESKEK